MKKTDYKKTYKHLYNPPKKAPEIVEVPKLNFLMIDGINAMEENPEFQKAIQALFAVSYKIKFFQKKMHERDYTVMPLEGLWWADDMTDFLEGNKQNWRWTLMIMQPDFVCQQNVQEAIEAVIKSKPNDSYNLLRLEEYTEGNAAQMMHIGPYSEEHENIMKLHKLIEENNGSFDGKTQKHHEIYLSDFRRVAPEKLKTVLRQPFV